MINTYYETTDGWRDAVKDDDTPRLQVAYVCSYVAIRVSIIEKEIRKIEEKLGIEPEPDFEGYTMARMLESIRQSENLPGSEN